jgi:protein TonB
MSAQAVISADLGALTRAALADVAPAKRPSQMDAARAPHVVEVTDSVAQSNVLSSPAPWLPQPVTQKSLFGKSGLLIVVVLGHLAAAMLLSLAPATPMQTVVAPLQVQLLSEPQTEQRNEPPPPVQLQTFDMALPVEPLTIDVATEANNAITVAVKSEPAQPTAESAAQPKLVSSVEYVREPAAKYPPAARATKQRGIVTLRALIDPQGHAREVNVHRSSGFRLLDDAARVAVLGALFKPYMENGRALPVYVLIPIEFGAG